MPRFYFSCEGALSFQDKVGTDLPDLKAAQNQAIEQAGEILRESADRFRPANEWRMTVSNDAGRSVYLLNFAAETP
jgi:hypothetical protein